MNVETRVDKLPLKSLLSMQGKIQKAIKVAKVRERSEVRAEMARLCARKGFSLAEVVNGHAKPRKTSRPRYMNPEKPEETWTGRGRKPNWLLARLAKGAKLDEFKVA